MINVYPIFLAVLFGRGMSEVTVRNSGIFFAHEVARKSQFEMISDGIDTLAEGGFLLAVP